MKIVISSGHGAKIPGAIGIINEHKEAVRVVKQVAANLQALGVTVVTFEDTTSTTQQKNLETIVNFHNAQGPHDLDISVHFNAYVTTTKPMGTECLYYSQQELSAEVTAGINKVSQLINRGAKKRTDLYFLNHTVAPSILIEVCFVDSSADVALYEQHFIAICDSIAKTASGENLQPLPPPQVAKRPVISNGDYGPDVALLQQRLNITADEAFGSQTESAVKTFQSTNGLEVDGVVGENTWAELDRVTGPLPLYPPPLLSPLSSDIVDQIRTLAANSAIANYNWKDRGKAPAGYTQGMAIAYATAYRKWLITDTTSVECAKANSGNDSLDALAWYADVFRSLNMNNDHAGKDTLRHLWVLLMGLGMRESSGRHCEGRDLSASNVSSDTAEAGLFQQSWNSSTCNTELPKLLVEYASGLEGEPAQCALAVFEDGVSCTSSEWGSYGSGDGRQFQDECKQCPQFACEAAAVGLRRLRQHWGPINRKEAEVKTAADELFQGIENIIDAQQLVA